MPRAHNAKGRSLKDGRFVRLLHTFLNTAAWRSLTPQARAIYVELSSRYNGSNNGEISLSVREAAHLCNMAPGTASRSLRELQERGFVRVVVPGGFSRKVRHATTWELTEFPLRVGTPAKRDFQNWRADLEKQNAVSIRSGHVPYFDTGTRRMRT